VKRTKEDPALILACTREEPAPGICWTRGQQGILGVSPVGMTAGEAKVLCRGPPPLQLRFPVGTRIDETLDPADQQPNSGNSVSMRRAWSWSRGTVVRQWWQGNNLAAGEWASYQLKMNTDSSFTQACSTQTLSLFRERHPRRLKTATGQMPQIRSGTLPAHRLIISSKKSTGAGEGKTTTCSLWKL